MIASNVVVYDISDHVPVMLTVKNKLKKVNFKKFLTQDFKNFDSQSFLCDLETGLNNCEEFDGNQDVNLLWNKFEDIFSKTVFSHAPLRSMTKKERRFRSKPWLTKGIIKSIKVKNSMFRLALCHREKSFSVEFKKYRNLLTKVKKLSKKLYFRDSIKKSSGNMKQLWRTVNNI